MNVHRNRIILETHPCEKIIPQEIIDIYTSSFPLKEQRPLDDLVHLVADGEIKLIIAKNQEDVIVGFMTYWDFLKFRYVEHLAINPNMRGRYFGSKLLGVFIKTESTPIILEVEPIGANVDAERRINFYHRHGFEIVDTEYVQPPYADGLPAVPLYLMSTSKIDTVEVTHVLHTYVYGQKGY